MKNLIENYINGNLTVAKEKAKKFSQYKIYLYLIEEAGWGWNKAAVTAMYLKNEAPFQAACDTE